MKKRAPKPASRLLTEVELEVMNLVWKLAKDGDAPTVADVIEALPPERKLAYTSVSTMLRILETKGVVEARKVGRGHAYAPKVEKAEYEAKSLQHLVDKVFGGAPSSLVRCLLQQENLSGEERASIEQLLKGKAAR